MDYLALSKTISHALRHSPTDYGLNLDKNGYILLDYLLVGLQKHSRKYQNITIEDIEYVVDNDEKGRYEIKDNKIRALYGHSFKIEKERIVPPDKLYHGTTREAFKEILTNGLQPMNRQFVHLSVDIETAKNVALRHSDDIIILEINSKNAFEDGIGFYEGNELTYLADEIPIKYIEQMV